MGGREVVEAVREKVRETIERTEHLIGMTPSGQLGWSPGMAEEAVPDAEAQAIDLGHLLGHLLTCLAGFCAAFYAAFPETLSEFERLRGLSVDHSCMPEEAKKQIAIYAAAIEKGFACCREEDLVRKVKTVFVPEGETLMTLLLGNLEHLMNHKYQLFFYLKMLGVKAGTEDLYRLRGTRE
jgi:hypothetical protein